MPFDFLTLILHTVAFWILVIALHWQRKRITLIPLYALIGAFIVYTHSLSDFGLAVDYQNFHFLISSTAYFTSMLLGFFLLYLFDGPRAARKALEVMILISIIHVFTVFIINLEGSFDNWVQFSFDSLRLYGWSVSAMVIDVVALAFGWELLGRFKRIPLLLRIIVMLWLILALDTVVFVTGYFGATDFYWQIISGDLITRTVLSLILGIFMIPYLRYEKFSEDQRDKPEFFWEIINLKSGLEKKVENLEQDIEKQKELEKQLLAAQEVYDLAIKGSSAGIWDWDIESGNEKWSAHFFELLGYEKGEIAETFDKFNDLLHPDDRQRTKSLVNQHFANPDKPFKIEYRLRTKSGEYRWFLGSGQVKLDSKKKPKRMVGSIIDIEDRKKAEEKLEEQLAEVSRLNALMVDRELKMSDMKKELRKSETPAVEVTPEVTPDTSKVAPKS